MDGLFGLASARPAWGVLKVLAAAGVFALFGAPVEAQQPAQPKAAPAPAKAPPKATQQKAPTTPAAPAPPAQATAPEQPPLIFSPWTKFCMKAPDPNAKQVCVTGKEGKFESGQPILSAVLIEPEGEAKKILRVIVPLGMVLQYGTRLLIDQGQPAAAPYVVCFVNGCMSDYEANAEIVGNMKKGQSLHVQAVSASSGQGFTLSMPLGDFAKAYDGPPTDPKVFEEQQKKLQEELQRRADEARRKLEQGTPPAPGKTQ
jgi:invasion protein IalB